MAPGALPKPDLILVPLDVSPSRLAELTASLSPDEHEFAARLRHPDRWRAARGWLRRVLADDLDVDPGALQLITEPGGKPRLAGQRWHFSLARSGALALIVTSPTAAVGVDLEAVRTIPDRDNVASRFFTAAEYRALDRTPSELRDHAFLECWTLKEAYGKAIGAGLGYPTATVDVWAGDGGGVILPGWELAPVHAGPGLVAALAIAVDQNPETGPSGVADIAFRAARGI